MHRHGRLNAILWEIVLKKRPASGCTVYTRIETHTTDTSPGRIANENLIKMCEIAYRRRNRKMFYLYSHFTVLRWLCVGWCRDYSLVRITILWHWMRVCGLLTDIHKWVFFLSKLEITPRCMCSYMRLYRRLLRRMEHWRTRTYQINTISIRTKSNFNIPRRIYGVYWILIYSIIFIYYTLFIISVTCQLRNRFHFHLYFH